ncbi:pre-rRNA-processing protein ESF2-like [Musa acuminata AAA Group]|uniref:pre-rRNA-processing protein ESF2 n=1 Tax=Musa acuminata AAA Group TaxID=214697 RepID=UPI0031CEFF37
MAAEPDEEPERHPMEDQGSFGDDAVKKCEGSKGRRKRKRSREDDDANEKRGVCYLSRVPPRMDPSHVRQILSQYGEIQRIYLVPEDPTSQVQRKQSGGFRGKEFSEGWVEFAKKNVAKKVARMLNGEQIGGKKRSAFYYDIWNIRYLSKFKWDDLIGELAGKKRECEEKLKLEISAAKRERDFYMSKVEQSRALKFMRERKEKKQRFEGQDSEGAQETKVIRQHPQNRPVADGGLQSKLRLSKDLLAGVFGRSSS